MHSLKIFIQPILGYPFYLSLFLFFFFNGNAQSPAVLWNKTYGGSGVDISLEVVQDTSGNLYVGGQSTSPPSGNKTAPHFGSSDFFILKLKPNGDTIWTRAYGGQSQELFRHLVYTSNDEIILAGSSESLPSGNKTAPNIGGFDFYAILINSNGDTIWTNTYGTTNNDFCTSVVADTSGGYILGGYTETVNNNEDYFLVGIDSIGNQLWNKTIGGSGFDKLENLVLDSIGNIVVAGRSNSPKSGAKVLDSLGGMDYWTLKLKSSDRSILWQSVYGGTKDDEQMPIRSTDGKNFFIGGSSNSDSTGNKITNSYGGKDLWFLKVNKNGKIRWQKQIGGSQDDTLMDFIPLSNGGYFHIGTTKSSQSKDIPNISIGKTDGLVVRTRAKGIIKNIYTIGGTENDMFRSAVETGKNTIVISGHSNSPAYNPYKNQNSFGSFDIYLIKIKL